MIIRFVDLVGLASWCAIVDALGPRQARRQSSIEALVWRARPDDLYESRRLAGGKPVRRSSFGQTNVGPATGAGSMKRHDIMTLETGRRAGRQRARKPEGGR